MLLCNEAFWVGWVQIHRKAAYACQREIFNTFNVAKMLDYGTAREPDSKTIRKNELAYIKNHYYRMARRSVLSGIFKLLRRRTGHQGLSITRIRSLSSVNSTIAITAGACYMLRLFLYLICGECGIMVLSAERRKIWWNKKNMSQGCIADYPGTTANRARA